MTQLRKAAGEGHHVAIRVYYEDTDAGGIVYYANYLRFAERARTEFLRSLGFERTDERFGVAFAVRHCTADYLASARLDDLLDVETRLLDTGGASLKVEQAIRRDGTELVRLIVRVACIRSDGKAVRMPMELRDALKAYASHFTSKRKRSA